MVKAVVGSRAYDMTPVGEKKTRKVRNDKKRRINVPFLEDDVEQLDRIAFALSSYRTNLVEDMVLTLLHNEELLYKYLEVKEKEGKYGIRARLIPSRNEGRVHLIIQER